MSKLLTPQEELKLCKGDAKWVPQLIRLVMTATDDSPSDYCSDDDAGNALLEFVYKRSQQLEERDV